MDKVDSVSVEVSEEVVDGIYSNFAIIAHSSTEFVVDFARIVPNMPKARVKSRIILAPEHAKRLLMALQDNVSKYEKRFGPIGREDADELNPRLPFGFGNSGEA